jgi:hypothetical protein
MCYCSRRLPTASDTHNGVTSKIASLCLIRSVLIPCLLDFLCRIPSGLDPSDPIQSNPRTGRAAPYFRHARH